MSDSERENCVYTEDALLGQCRKDKRKRGCSWGVFSPFTSHRAVQVQASNVCGSSQETQETRSCPKRRFTQHGQWDWISRREEAKPVIVSDWLLAARCRRNIIGSSARNRERETRNLYVPGYTHERDRGARSLFSHIQLHQSTDRLERHSRDRTSHVRRETANFAWIQNSWWVEERRFEFAP